MKSAWPWALPVAAVALAACWNFEGAYDACVDAGVCVPGGNGDPDGGRDGGPDGGGTGGPDGGSCPPGSPSGNGLCLVQRHDVAYPVYGVFGVSPGTVYFGGWDDSFSTWRASGLEEASTYFTNYVLLADLHGISENDVWAAGQRGFAGYSYAYHFDGSTWADLAPAGFASGECNGVWAEDAGYAFLACENGVYRVSTSSQPQTVVDTTGTGTTLSGVWGLPGGPAWAVGGAVDRATIRRRQGATWTTQDFIGRGHLNAVHGRSDHDAWAVGDGAELMRLDDAGWRTVTSALAGVNLEDVFVTPSGEAWITSGANRVMVIDPGGTQRVFVPPGMSLVPGALFLHRVQVFDSGEVWLTATTDDGGTLYHGAMLHYRKL